HSPWRRDAITTLPSPKSRDGIDTTASLPAAAIAYPNEKGQEVPSAESASKRDAIDHPEVPGWKRYTWPLPCRIAGAPTQTSPATTAIDEPKAVLREASNGRSSPVAVQSPDSPSSSTYTTPAPGAPT